jgi:hypothetical protein
VVLHGFDHGAVLQVRRAARHLHATRRRNKCVRNVAVAADFVAARRRTSLHQQVTTAIISTKASLSC